MGKYYVYSYCYRENEKPFYIGKGSGNRYKDKNFRNKKFNEIINNNEYVIKFLYVDLDNETALLKEKELINSLDGLCNVNDIDIEVIEKKCSKCGEIKSYETGFYHNSNKSSKCKSCYSLDNKSYRERNK